MSQSGPEFIYVTYIRTTAEALWDALTGADFTPRYWYGLLVSVGPNVGDPFSIHSPQGEPWDEGEVLEANRPHRLSYTFHPIANESDRMLEPSRVVFVLEPMGEVVKLTLTHDRFDPRGDHLNGVARGWTTILSGLKSMLETGDGLGATVDNPPSDQSQNPNVEGRTRVFVTYIRANPEAVWHALTDGETTRRYFFGRRAESDWQVGSAYNFWHDEGHGLDVTGQVLESDPPHRLVLTWSVPWVEELRGMPPSKVSYTIEPQDGYVRLTVFEEVPDEIPGRFLEGGKQGWPMILSGLKTLLETGNSLPIGVPTSGE